MTTDITVKCRICGKPTTMLGTKLCDRCWELETRIVSNIELAKKIFEANNIKIDTDQQDTISELRQRLSNLLDTGIRQMEDNHKLLKELSKYKNATLWQRIRYLLCKKMKQH